MNPFALQNMDAFRDYVRSSGLYGRGTDLGKARPAELRVQLTGNGGDQGRGPGDVRLPKLGDVPVQEGQVRVQRLAPHGGVLHGHLLFQEEAHEDGADEVAVELGIAL